MQRVPLTFTAFREQQTMRLDRAVALILVFAFLSFFQPAQYAIPSALYLAWRGAVLVVSVASTALYLLTKKISARWTVISLLFFICIVLSSYVQDASLSTIWVASQFFKAVGFLSLLEISFAWNKRTALACFICAGTIMLCLHIGSYALYADVVGGMRAGYVQTELGRVAATDGNWYLLTYDNDSIFYFLPVLTSLWYYALTYSKWAYVPFAFMSAVALMMYVVESAATVSVSLTAFLLLGIIFVSVFAKTGVPRCIYAWVLGGGVAFCSIVVFFVVSGGLETVASFFHKSATFSGRAQIWEMSLEIFESHPLFGVGVDDPAATAQAIGHTHCHNLIVQVLYSGGVFALFLLLMAFIAFMPSRMGIRHEQRLEIGYAAICAGIAAFFIAAGLDWLYSNPLFIVMLVLARDCRPENRYHEHEESYAGCVVPDRWSAGRAGV